MIGFHFFSSIFVTNLCINILLLSVPNTSSELKVDPGSGGIIWFFEFQLFHPFSSAITRVMITTYISFPVFLK